MGTFYVGCHVEHHVHRKRCARITKMLVDTGSEYTWISGRILREIQVTPEKKDVAFIMANGPTITRKVGFAIIRFNTYFTIDEVVFAEEGDLQLLGARTLEGLNLVVDARQKKLVASGPLPVALTVVS